MLNSKLISAPMNWLYFLLMFLVCYSIFKFSYNFMKGINSAERN